MKSSEQNNLCPRCRAACAAGANFCQACGWDLRRPYTRMAFGRRQAVVLVAGAALVFAASYALTELSPIGRKPTQRIETRSMQGMSAAHGQQAQSADPVIAELRKKAESNRTSVDGWQALVEKIFETLRSAEQPDSQLVMEAIDALREMLKIDPKNSYALLQMADLSFNQAIFDKAADYYRRYLEGQPDDLRARSRYGGALMFVGKSAEGEAELKAVLAKDPRNFEAAAQLAILYIRAGEIQKGDEMAVQATALAPNEETRSEFTEFVAGLKAHPTPAPSAAASPAVESPAAVTPAPPAAESEPRAAALEAYIRTVPIAAAKFVHSEFRDPDTIVIYFSGFPMEQMPPAVKDKLLNGLRDAARSGAPEQVKTVLLLEHTDGRELARVAVR